MRFLSPEWVDAFNAAVRDAPLPDPAENAGIATRAGTYAWCQVVTGGPGDDGSRAVTLRVADGRLTMEQGEAADAAVTIRIGWDDAAAMALGRLAPTEAIAAGRVRVRGDLAVLRAGQSVLDALAPKLAGLQAAASG